MHSSFRILFGICVALSLRVHAETSICFLSTYSGATSPLSLKIQWITSLMLYASNALLPSCQSLSTKFFLALPFLYPFLDIPLLFIGRNLWCLSCLSSSLDFVLSFKSYLKNVSLVSNSGEVNLILYLDYISCLLVLPMHYYVAIFLNFTV